MPSYLASGALRAEFLGELRKKGNLDEASGESPGVFAHE